MDIKITGLDKLQKSLKRLESNIKNLDGKKFIVNNEKDIDKKVSEEILRGV